MLPRQHIAYSAGAAVALIPFLRQKAAAFWLASWAMDVDHYLWYVWHFRSLNLMQAYRYFKQEHGKPFPKGSGRPRAVVILHALEVLLALGLLTWRWPWSRAAYLGILFHMVLDVIEDRRVNGVLDREYFLVGVIYDRLIRQRRPQLR